MSKVSELKSEMFGLSNYAKGVIAGVFSAMAFGFIPVFSKPMLNEGMTTKCVLFYRFFIAAMILLLILKVQRKQVLVGMRYAPSLVMQAVFYSFSGGLLVYGYNYMSGGVTTVIHFVYPVFVMVVSMLFFKERASLASIAAIVLAIAGIFCLSVLGGDASFVPGANRIVGVIIVLLSGVACGSYIVGVNQSKAHELPSLTFTFWLLLITSAFFFAISLANGSLQPLVTAKQWGCFLGIALIATIFSNISLVFSARYVGSTLASILGAVEPTTAVIMCILLFGETLNQWICIGIALVFAAVMIVVKRNKH